MPQALPSTVATARLRLTAATVALARAELSDRSEFARLLQAAVPASWPPESLADALPFLLAQLEAAPDRAGWFGWYAVTLAEPSVLVASAGFFGPPSSGAVEIGYSVLPQFQRNGYATEMVAALVRLALAQPGVSRVLAHTEWANPASVRVLTKAGFHPAGDPNSADDPNDANSANGARFECPGPREQSSAPG